jgi:preprotein translocase subunit SecD
MFSRPANSLLNKYPWWKNLLLLVMVAVGIIYAMPNLYGEIPAVQITNNTPGIEVDANLLETLEQQLQTADIAYTSVGLNEHYAQIRFKDSDAQMQAQSLLEKQLGDDYTVALSLATATPSWLRALGAEPMKYGLDLRGGVHFLLDVDAESVLAQRMSGVTKNIREELRNAKIRYSSVRQQGSEHIALQLRDAEATDQALSLLRRQFSELEAIRNADVANQLTAHFTQQALSQARDQIIEQTMSVLRKRVDELGVSNAVVQRQGLARVSVDLPGVLDAGSAKQILGGTATLEFRLVDDRDAFALNGQAPSGTRLYELDGYPILIRNEVVLPGSAITRANSSIGEGGMPEVIVRLGGGGETRFNRITRANVGKRLAIIYVQTKIDTKQVNGESVRTQRKIERVISAPTIQSALGTNFQITGIGDAREALNLAVILSSGALPAAIDIVQERTVGPTLGKENIQRGLVSISVGFLLVVIFMAVYYRLLGIYANIALLVNLILLTAILSGLGMVLTLPGIAGIVLTVGMAVDANVLIFERIREELRNGMSVQAAINAGFDHAFTAIVDAQVTTLIAALALFGIGTGPIKGFAVTLTVGLVTSMITAIIGTRALVNLTYGGRNVKKVSVGI